MKSKLLILLIALIFSCKEKETNKVPIEEPTTVQKKCTDKPKPRNLDELNKQVKLNINLDNQCEFQPIHIEVCEPKIYAVIGRFKSKKGGQGNEKKITSIEMHAYNLARNNKKYKVTKS